MRPQTLLVLILALAFGGIAAAGVVFLGDPGPGQGGDRAAIAFAAADVPRGESLSAESVEIRQYPKDLATADHFTKAEDVVGRMAMIPLIKGEPILGAKLAPKGAGRGLAPMIKKGMRAISIPTPSVAAGVAGFIMPGSRVDVHWTAQEVSRDQLQDGADPPLLENVEVLAVDEKTDMPAANRMDAIHVKSVTLQVRPEDAGKLTPAMSKGTIHLSLRNPSDDGRAPPRPAPSPKPEPVLAAAPPPPPPPPPPPRAIRMIRGTRETTIHLDPLPEPKKAG